jgi:hypothetical protein
MTTGARKSRRGPSTTPTSKTAAPATMPVAQPAVPEPAATPVAAVPIPDTTPESNPPLRFGDRLALWFWLLGAAILSAILLKDLLMTLLCLR